MAHLIMTQGGEVSITDLLNEYFGFGGAAGGSGGTYAGGATYASGATYANGQISLAAIGAALAATIIKDKTNKTHLENLKPGTETKLEQKYKPLEAIDEMIGRQELLIPPNAGTATKQEQEYKPIEPIDEMIGKKELPYLPNLKTEAIHKEKTITANPLYPPEGQEEIKDPIPSPSIIPDETGKNEEINISPTFDMQNMYDFILQQQQRQWDREDAIRAETQEREDNAWQRAIEDMRKAGVNPNLVNASPAESGGGITQATGLNYSPWESEVNKNLALLEQEINNAFKEDEATKDRITEMITSILSMFTFATITKGK